MTPLTISIFIIKVRIALIKGISKKYSFSVKMAPLAIPLLILSLFFLIKKSLLLAMFFLILSNIFYVTPKIFRVIMNSFHKKAQASLDNVKKYEKFKKELGLSVDREKVTDILKQIEDIKKNDKDLKMGKIIYWILVFFYVIICFLSVNYLFDLLLRSL